MSWAARIPEPPRGFELTRGHAGVLAYRRGSLDALRAGGFTADGRHAGPGADSLVEARESGREPLGFLEVDGVPCLVRRFSHGGWLRPVTGRRFRDPSRPFVELQISERLRTAGVPTPAVVAARAVRTRPLGFELTLVTERVEGTRDAGELLGRVRRGESSRAELRGALRSTGRLVAALHALGFVHADLQPANLLVDRSDPSRPAHAVDLDRSRFEPSPLAPALATQNLARLWRHVARREADHGAVLSRTDRVRFLLAYGLDRHRLDAECRAIEHAASESGGLHRLGWWLERRLGRDHDPRAARRPTHG